MYDASSISEYALSIASPVNETDNCRSSSKSVCIVMGQAVILAAPESGSGKTTLTLALLRAMRRRGIVVGSAKIGPDYIDPTFHRAASGRPCLSIDSWAMQQSTFYHQTQRITHENDFTLVEGVMGLFDGTPDGTGSTAHVAKLTEWPIILIVDASGMAASAAALIKGFNTYDPDIKISGIIFNRVGSDRHGQLLTKAVETSSIPVLGYVCRNSKLELPNRHLGLIQAEEITNLNDFLEDAATLVGEQVDLLGIRNLGTSCIDRSTSHCLPIPIIGQRLALARDSAFAFSYEFIIEGWRREGVEILPFSPLANEAPNPNADAVYLPGGYPELHAETLANATRFLEGVRQAARKRLPVYGECGGYMVLGETLQDNQGSFHKMCGLLPVKTSFLHPKLTLGYRDIHLNQDCVLGSRKEHYKGHEFHFSSATMTKNTQTLFEVSDTLGDTVGSSGCQVGSVAGSYLHLIDGPQNSTGPGH